MKYTTTAFIVLVSLVLSQTIAGQSDVSNPKTFTNVTVGEGKRPTQVLGFDLDNRVVLLHDGLISKRALERPDNDDDVMTELGALKQKCLSSAGAGTSSIGNQGESDFSNSARIQFHKSGQLLINFDKDLWLYNNRSESCRRLTSSPDKEEKFEEFSPDGKFVSYISGAPFAYKLFLLIPPSQTASPVVHEIDMGNEVTGFIDWKFDPLFRPTDLFSDESLERKSYAWSPDSKAIVFTHYDMSNIPNTRVTVNSTLRAENRTGQSATDWKYPLTNQVPQIDVSYAKLAILPPAGGKVRTVFPVKIPGRTERLAFVNDVRWTNNDSFVFQLSDVGQKEFNLLKFEFPKSASADQAKPLIPDPLSMDAYVIPRSQTFTGDKQYALLEANGSSRLYQIDVTADKFYKPLTPEDLYLKTLVNVDEKTRFAYFTASTNGNLAALELYRLNIDSKVVSKLSSEGTVQLAQLDPTGQYAAVISEGIGKPPAFRVIDLNKASNIAISPSSSTSMASGSEDKKDVKDESSKDGDQKEPNEGDKSSSNDGAKEGKSATGLTQPSSKDDSTTSALALKSTTSARPLVIENMKVGSGEASVAILRKQGSDPDAKTKTIIYINPIPMSAGIENRFNPVLEKLFSEFTEMGYVVVVCNPRIIGGSLKKGGPMVGQDADFLKIAKALPENYKFIDAENMGLIGFNYGGYIALTAALTFNAGFKWVVAVNPLTDLAVYSYTQRTFLLNAGSRQQAIADMIVNNPSMVPTLIIHNSQNVQVMAEHSIKASNAFQTGLAQFGRYKADDLQVVFYEDPESTNGLTREKDQKLVLKQIFNFIRNQKVTKTSQPANNVNKSTAPAFSIPPGVPAANSLEQGAGSSTPLGQSGSGNQSQTASPNQTQGTSVTQPTQGETPEELKRRQEEEKRRRDAEKKKREEEEKKKKKEEEEKKKKSQNPEIQKPPVEPGSIKPPTNGN